MILTRTYRTLLDILESVAERTGDPQLDDYLSEIDIRPNGLKYGILESENPDFTLQWKRCTEGKRRDRLDSGFSFAKDFLKRTLDPERSAEIADHLSEDIFTAQYRKKLAIDLAREGLYLLGLLDIPAAKEEVNLLRHTIDNPAGLVRFIHDRSGDYPSDFDLLSGYLKSLVPGEICLSRAGKVLFGLLADHWFIYQPEVSKDNPVFWELRDLDRVPDYPSPLWIASRLFQGYGLEFTVADRRYFALYPLDSSIALLYEDGKLIARRSIDGFMTAARYRMDPGSSKRLDLFKAFKASKQRRIIAPREALARISS